MDRTFVYSRYDRIIAISEGVHSMLIDNLESLKYRILVIKNGVDTFKISRTKSISKNELGISQSSIVITQVAKFNIQKDRKTLLRALRLLPQEYYVLFVGDGRLLDEHREMVKLLNLENRAHFLGIRNDVPVILKMSDIIVMSSNYEGFGLAAVEGMAAGKPLIASNVPGLSEVVRGAGILFEVHDEQEFAKDIF